MAILVDSSVWIGLLCGVDSPRVRMLRAPEVQPAILVGDLILAEVLMGARDERHAARIERGLRVFGVVAMLDDAIAVRAAANYRALRARGITVRKTIDLLIATFCIARGHALLHDDRDFAPFEAHLGLRAIRA